LGQGDVGRPQDLGFTGALLGRRVEARVLNGDGSLAREADAKLQIGRREGARAGLITPDAENADDGLAQQQGATSRRWADLGRCPPR
jgi:hypothetical protein